MPDLLQNAVTHVTEYTVFGSANGSPRTDVSQFANNLTDQTANGDVGDERNGTRFMRDVDRTIRARVAGSGSGTHVVYHRNPTTNSTTTADEGTERITLTFSPLTVIFQQRISGTLTNLISLDVSALGGNTNDLFISLATFANPNTTGASNAVRHEMTVLNNTTGITFRGTAVGPRGGVGTGTNRMTIGFDFVTNGGTFNRFSFDHKAQPFMMLREKWISATSAPGSTACVVEKLSPMLHRSTTWANTGTRYGPQVMAAARHHQTVRRRSFSPLVNEQYEVVTAHNGEEQREGSPDHKLWCDAPSSGSSHRVMLNWLRKRPVPRVANVVFSQIHSRFLGTAAARTVRLYSADDIPGRQTDFRFVELAINRSDTSTDGGWDAFDLLPIVRDARGFTVLYLAVGGYLVSDTTHSFQLQAWHACPRVASGALAFGRDV